MGPGMSGKLSITMFVDNSIGCKPISPTINLLGLVSGVYSERFFVAEIASDTKVINKDLEDTSSVLKLQFFNGSNCYPADFLVNVKSASPGIFWICKIGKTSECRIHSNDPATPLSGEFEFDIKFIKSRS